MVSSVPSESAVAPATNPAVAELDQNCCAIFGTQTVLTESPGLVASAKHGLIDSDGTELTTLLPCPEKQTNDSDGPVGHFVLAFSYKRTETRKP